MLQNRTKLIALCCLVVAGLLVSFPNIDLLITSQFYIPANGTRGFFLARQPMLLAIHESLQYGVITLLLAYAAIGLWLYRSKKAELWGLTHKHLIYLTLVMAIGPGLIVNGVFKEHWGRARPAQVDVFGGDKHFTPPLVMTDQCDSNCSFTSGDPSVGFYFFAWMMVAATLPRKKQALYLALSAGGLLGLMRIAQGAHFFSDVVFTGMILYWTAFGLYRVMFGKE